MKAVYPALFERLEDGGFGVRFPDLPGCVTTGKDIADALAMAEDVVNLWICTNEELGNPIPAPSDFDSIHPEPGFFCNLVPVDSDLYRRQINTYAVRRNVSIPAWMDTLCRQRNINVSQVLQDSLRQLFDQ